MDHRNVNGWFLRVVVGVFQISGFVEKFPDFFFLNEFTENGG